MHKNFCRGPSLLCMNEILLRLGEFNEVMDAKDKSTPSAKKRCLAACENQVLKLKKWGQNIFKSALIAFTI